MEFGLLNKTKEKYFKPLIKYHYSFFLSLLVIAGLLNSFSMATFSLVLCFGVYIVSKSVYSLKKNESLDKVDLLTDIVFLILILGIAFFFDVYRRNINTHDLFRVEDEFKVLGTMGDFFGGASSLLIGLFTLIFVINESRENRKINDARDRREDRRELYDLNQLMLSMFIKRVEFLEDRLSTITVYYNTRVYGIKAIRVYAEHRFAIIKDDVYSFLSQLDDLVEESISFSSAMALGKGVDAGVKSLRNYKTKLLAGLVSIENLDVYWKIFRSDGESINKWSYICSLMIVLKNQNKEVFDLTDEDYKEIDLFYKSLILSDKKINLLMNSCSKLS